MKMNDMPPARNKTDQELLLDCRTHLAYGMCNLPTEIFNDFEELLNRYADYLFDSENKNEE